MDALKAIGEVVGQRMGGLFDRSFLFASLIPTLLLFAAAATGFALATGAAGSLARLESLAPLRATLLAVAVSITLVLFAQVLAALRPLLLALWSGLHPLCPPPPLRHWLERRQRSYQAEFDRLAQQPTRAGEIASELKRHVFAIWPEPGTAPAELPPAGEAAKQDLKTRGERLCRAGPGIVVKAEIAGIVDLYHRYSIKSLEPEWKALVDALHTAATVASLPENEARATLGRRFGPEGTLRPTRLGNLLEAHHAYPFRRYAIEGSVFWPRLAFVVPPELLARLEDRRSLLDFWIASASLSVIAARTFAGSDSAHVADARRNCDDLGLWQLSTCSDRGGRPGRALVRRLRHVPLRRRFWPAHALLTFVEGGEGRVGTP
jgi:hypothetical protein